MEQGLAMKILYLFADQQSEWNASEWRCAIPYRAINKSSGHEAKMLDVGSWIVGTPEAKEKSWWADVIVVQRLFLGQALVAMEFWKARDKIIIGDVDDAYDLMPRHVPTYRFWQEGLSRVTINGKEMLKKMEFTPVEQLIWGAKLCHAVATPSKILTRDWSKYIGDKAIYVPNYTELNHYLLRHRPMPNPNLTIIGWGGSLSHYDSFKHSGVVPALIKLLNKKPNVVLCLAGGVRQISTLFIRDVNPDQILVKEWVPYAQWPSILADFQIGLIPLYGPYDQRRSPIRPLEYAAMGIPWIGSKSKVYDEFESLGTQVDNTEDAWYKAILEMVEDLPRFRKDISDTADLVSKWDINNNLENIVGSYRIDGTKRIVRASVNGKVLDRPTMPIQEINSF